MDPVAFAERLARVDGVVAVCLGGSRARGAERPDSDWDFGLYYRGHLDTAALRALGLVGEIVEPGAWGRLMNGGAWLRLADERVDLLYRDLDAVEHWRTEAEQGRFQIDAVPGYIAGMPSYALLGEMALNQVLIGSLPRPTFPAALRREAPRRWYSEASFSLLYADSHAVRGDPVACAGVMARATIASAHARLAERGVWALNDKGIVHDADLTEASDCFRGLDRQPIRLHETVDRLRAILDLGRPDTLALDTPVR